MLIRLWKPMLLGALMGACGGNTPKSEPTPAPPVETSGTEIKAPEEVQEPEPEAVPSGPAKLTVVAKLAREAVPAHVKVYAEDRSLAAEGETGEPLTVPAGNLTIAATLADAKVLLGNETIHHDVTLEPGQEATEQVVFERCLARVNVRIRGKLDTTAVVTLSKDGQEIAKLKSGATDYVAIVPGRYQASVKSARAQITVSDIALNEGATETIPIDVE